MSLNSSFLADRFVEGTCPFCNYEVTALVFAITTMNLSCYYLMPQKVHLRTVTCSNHLILCDQLTTVHRQRCPTSSVFHAVPYCILVFPLPVNCLHIQSSISNMPYMYSMEGEFHIGCFPAPCSYSQDLTMTSPS